jgi:aminomethyltransferase
MTQTPFYDQHISSGAKIVDFHGWEMPLQYSGIIDEHKNLRSNVGLFDVSHMGRFKITGTSAENCLQNLLTNDVTKISDLQAIYSPMCSESGGILDDVIAYRINEDDFLMVVNSSNIEKDFAWVVSHSQDAHVENITDQMALLALQGPASEEVLKAAGLELSELKRFHLISTKMFDVDCLLARTGYTGEDGFEIFFSSSHTEIWDKLLEIGINFGIKPVGLGARDTLRLEAGLMLYGNDIDEKTTPLEAPLSWTVKFDCDFIGKSALEKQQVERKLVGFEILGINRIARKDNAVLADDLKVGIVTSGSFSPTLSKSIGFCFVPVSVSDEQIIQIEIGNKPYDAKVTGTRFYKRG